MLFESGEKIVTEAISDNVSKELVHKLFARHLSGDWGDLSDQEKKNNEDALRFGGPIFSGYFTGFGKVYIVTEKDRRFTKIFFSNDLNHAKGGRSLGSKKLNTIPRW